MTKDALYAYTDRDLLAEPETYEYSEVHGGPFLRAYLGDRSETIEDLKGRLGESHSEPNDTGWDGLLGALTWADVEAIRPHLPELDLETAPPTNGGTSALATPVATSVDTTTVLGTILGYPGNSPRGDDVVSEWLNFFTKRYEVDKRLFAAYDGDGSPENGDDAPFVAYPMLELAALLRYERTGNLKYLNVALKLGDLLSSKVDGLRATGTLALVELAIDEERGAVRTLMDSKGIEL